MRIIKKGLILALYIFMFTSVINVVNAEGTSNFLEGKTVEKDEQTDEIIVKDGKGTVWSFYDGKIPEDWTDSNGNTYWLIREDQVSLVDTVSPKSKDAVLRIPDTIAHNGKVYRVTEVGNPFYLERPDGFSSNIGRGYKKIVYGKNVKELYQRVHDGVRSIEEITFKGKKIEIGQYAFLGCKNLKKINGLNRVDKIYPYAFCATGLKKLTLSDVSVYWSAFSSCKNLTEVVISNNAGISEYTFFDCKNLRTVRVKKGLTYIGEEAFGDCPKLQKVVLPKSLSCIESGAFAWCINPKLKIMIPKKNKHYYVQNNCIISKKKKELVSVFGAPKIIVIPSDVKKVDSSAMRLDVGKKGKKIKAVVVKGKQTKFEKYAYPDKRIPFYYPKGGMNIKGKNAPKKQYPYSSIEIIKGKKIQYKK